MKKNLLSVLILVLMIVNIVLSAVMMMNIISTNKKTAELMDSIAVAMNLELYSPGEGPTVALSDTDTHSMGSQTIQLARSQAAGEAGGGKDVYIVFDIALLMDKTHADYAAYGETIASYDEVIKNTVSAVVSRYTEDECRASFTEDIRNEILEALQNEFQSKFIYGVTLSNIKYGG